MQYQNLGILQKVKYLNFGINSSNHSCTVMLMKNKQWVLFFTPRAVIVDLQGEKYISCIGK